MRGDFAGSLLDVVRTFCTTAGNSEKSSICNQHNDSVNHVKHQVWFVNLLYAYTTDDLTNTLTSSIYTIATTI